MSNISEHFKDGDGVAKRMRRYAIVTLRYKVYIFLIIVAMVFIWPTVVATVDEVRWKESLKWLMSLWNIGTIWHIALHQRWKEWWLLNEIDDIDEKIKKTENDIKKVERQIGIIERLNDQQKRNTLITCLNTQECEGVPPELMPHLQLLRTYILVDNLEAEKMKFNQKLLLKNINDFLLRSVSSLENGRLSGVSFGNPELINKDHDIYRLPITLQVTFPNEKMFMSFLYNIEERVHTIIPVLYKIDALNYNIVNYPNEQDITISMSAYYILWLDEEIIEKEDE